jgi:hypothetical protein
MFFVSLLLNELVGWVRSQRGTSSLRALVYFDEVLGFLPPVANPPSKPPLLTLLKQARAFGVGMALATQNPVDLDYKALSNTGTWFLGRLQTQRDKDRLLDGLEGVAAGHLDRAEADGILSSLDKRVFLMHNVHEQRPVLFQTRWTMSYLRGPLGREEIARLTKSAQPVAAAPVGSTATLEARADETTVARPSPAEGGQSPSGVSDAPATSGTSGASIAPVLDPSIPQYFAPGTGSRYVPMLFGAARIDYSDAKLGVDETRNVAVTTPIVDGAVAVDWELAEPASFAVHDLARSPSAPLPFAPLPAAASQPRRYAQWQRAFAQWAAQSQSIELLRSDRARLTSHVGESERDFRIRVQDTLREARDEAIDKTRRKYASKLATAEDRVRRAEAAVAREQQQASDSKLQAGVSLMATIAGALLGRKAVSATTLGRATTTARGVGRIGREAQDVERAQAQVAAARQARDELAEELARELQQVAESFDVTNEQLSRVLVKPKRGAVSVQVVALVWIPA